MEAREQRVVLILADISGYTKYIVANQLAAVHGQMSISFLIETILREVDIPLVLHGIEGDAVFLSASHPGDDAAWRRVLAEVRVKLVRFFEVFLEGIVRTVESTPCDCPSCRHLEELKLKIIVHSGRAVFHTIAGIPQVSGADVIIAHRLLKNSVPSNEYLLMTDAAYQDLGREMEGDFQPGQEMCEGIGPVKTWVQLMGDARERARDALYAKPSSELAADARRYVGWALGAQLRYVVAQLRGSTAQPARPGRVALALRQGLEFLLGVPFLLVAARRRLLARQAERAARKTSDRATA